MRYPWMMALGWCAVLLITPCGAAAPVTAAAVERLAAARSLRGAAFEIGTIGAQHATETS